MSTAARRLRDLLAAPGVVRLMGAHNALGAKLAERHGFEGVWASGLEISTSYAVPDASILTMSEYLAAAQAMAAAVTIPVVADCDTGFGNSNNVIRMVRQYEAAGVAGVCIEDKLFPKVNSLTEGRQDLASVAEFVGKILAAKTAQESDDFVVIARIEALIAGWPLEEALRRADAYARAGADAILIHDKAADASGVRAFLAQWKATVPVVVVPTAYPHLTATDLGALGARVVIYANQGIRAAVRAMDETLARIAADGSTAAVEPTIAPLRTLFDLQGMPALRAAERDFLRTAQPATRAIVLSAGDYREAASMRDVANDVAIAALDVAGKPLLRRQGEALAQAGVQDVTVVTGYRRETVRAEGMRTAENANWATSGEVESLMTVPHDAAATTEVRTLVAYGDTLFDAELVRRVLASEADITVVADVSAQLRRVEEPKARDLLELAATPAPGRRFLAGGSLRVVNRVGTPSSPELRADAEFAGLVLFSPAGWQAACAWYSAHSAAQNGARPAGAQPRTAVTELLQGLITSGREVAAIEVTSGWLEIHSFADYQLACRLVTR